MAQFAAWLRKSSAGRRPDPRNEEEGIKEGIREGRKEERMALLRSLVDDGLLALSEAAKRAGISEQEFSRGMMEIA